MQKPTHPAELDLTPLGLVACARKLLGTLSAMVKTKTHWSADHKRAESPA